MEEALVRYIHFLGIIILSGSLVSEYLLLSTSVDIKSFRKLLIIDGVYGIGAVITFIAGLILWFSSGKSSEFYTHNYIFHLKLIIFIFVALLSILPTYYYIRNRKITSDAVIIPNSIINIVRIEIILLAILPLLAVLMARGIGNA